jgi:hypothetical protein
VESTIGNIFGRIFGNDETTISRSAVADFTGPAIMGSPCNAFGNQPVSNANAAPPATGSVIPGLADGGYQTCQDSPDFWALIEGPTEDKVQGDRYANRTCAGGEDFCSGSVNNEYREENYFWVIRVEEAAANTPITVELYDPAYIDTGSTCGRLDEDLNVNGINPFAPDGRERYRDEANIFCTGDQGSASRAMTTSFVLRAKNEQLDPLQGAPIAGCTKQFRGRSSPPSYDSLDEDDGDYNASLASVFHQWVTLCTFNPASHGGAGDYYLQVRSNVALPSGTGSGTYVTSADNSAVTAATGNETNTDGINGFAIRAYVSPISLGTSIAVSGYERMPIWVNASGSNATFNLLRVEPNAAGKVFTFSLFDLGDAGGGGTIRVLPPDGQTITGTCTVSSPQGTRSNLTDCQLPFTNQQFNGKLRTITVPVPSTYSCDPDSLGSCWWKVQLDYAGSVNDVTTWDASIQGDAVRLVE